MGIKIAIHHTDRSKEINLVNYSDSVTACLHNHISEFCPGHVIAASVQAAGGAVIGGAFSGEGDLQFHELSSSTSLLHRRDD